MIIRPEQAADLVAIDALLRDAFEGPAEAELVARLRSDGDLTLSLVAEAEGLIIGHIAFEPLRVEPDPRRVVWALAPMAVEPSRQRSGVGSALVYQGLVRAAEAGVGFVAVLGHADYYPRFGFRPELASGLEVPWSGPHFMGLALDGLPPPRGKAHYPSAFAALGEESR